MRPPQTRRLRNKEKPQNSQRQDCYAPATIKVTVGKSSSPKTITQIYAVDRG
jgi:hypothetical protein